MENDDEENDVVYIWYFKDRAVYGLDATGALVDGVIRPAWNNTEIKQHDVMLIWTN